MLMGQLAGRDAEFVLKSSRKMLHILVAAIRRHFLDRLILFQQHALGLLHPDFMQIAKYRSAEKDLKAFLELEVVKAHLARQL